MFRNSGKNIMILSKIICWVGIIVFIIIAILSFATIKGYIGQIIYYYKHGDINKPFYVELFERGIISIFGAFISYYVSLFVYGFGELVDRFCKTDNTYLDGRNDNEKNMN